MRDRLLVSLALVIAGLATVSYNVRVVPMVAGCVVGVVGLLCVLVG
jgi:hypothetical protein